MESLEEAIKEAKKDVAKHGIQIGVVKVKYPVDDFDLSPYHYCPLAATGVLYPQSTLAAIISLGDNGPMVKEL